MGNPFGAQGYNYDGSTGGGLFDVLSMFGQPQQGQMNESDLAQQLLQRQIAASDSAIALNGKQGALADRMGAPPSKWASGASTFGSIVDGLSGLGSMYLGWQNMKQQKKAFEFNKEVTNTNLNNSIMDYNRRLGDTLTNRSLNNGQGSGWVSEQLAKYSAKRG